MKKSQFYYWIIIVAFSFGFYAKSRIPTQADVGEQSLKIFQVPEVFRTDTISKLHPQKSKYLQSYYPSFLGKFSFGDTLFTDDRWREDADQDYLYFMRDSIDYFASDGFQLIPRPDIKLPDFNNMRDKTAAYFPVFLPNETSETKLLFGKSSYVYAIQEARDSSGDWRPIEHRGFDWCGMGRWELKVHPQEYAAMLMPLYQGNYATELRIIFKNGENKIISKPYTGTISYEQFYFKPDSYMKKWFEDSPLSVTFGEFYGSYPLPYFKLGGN